jgi:hypothetical protein
MNLQEQVTALVFAENVRVLSRVQGHASVLCTLGGGHRGVVNWDGEVLERESLPREEGQLRLVEVELEVVGRHPS